MTKDQKIAAAAAGIGGLILLYLLLRPSGSAAPIVSPAQAQPSIQIGGGIQPLAPSTGGSGGSGGAPVFNIGSPASFAPTSPTSPASIGPANSPANVTAGASQCGCEASGSAQPVFGSAEAQAAAIWPAIAANLAALMPVSPVQSPVSAAVNDEAASSGANVSAVRALIINPAWQLWQSLAAGGQATTPAPAEYVPAPASSGGGIVYA